MTQIGNIPQIKAVKEHLDMLKQRNLVKEWEVPYENILTSLTAAIFFLDSSDDSRLPEIWNELSMYKNLHYRYNDEKKLSQLNWRVEFKATNQQN